ncbi:hypothetical protein EHQ76_13675 [Leptospira barantonii]|uniref:Glycosyl transferase n=1 Tax=Leptospira barantonii TaxID=2023184 RepID=A0A5F2B1G6_9LEPT|nr:hypothetical protein [Leptospira barantonii]TGL98076.1 hypothetical protein EHQ76_13675 [Leptospira barantonii]
MRDFLFIACNNGFGHIKRVSSVIEKLRLLTENPKIVVVTGNAQKEYLVKGDFIKRYGLQVITEPFESIGSPNENYENAFRWTERLPKGILEERKIISDNYPAILNQTNATLMGSFLWSDVFAQSKNSIDVSLVSKETELLKLKKPKMICNRYFHMPSLERMTIPVKLPFFCDEFSERTKGFGERNSVLFSLGAGSADRTRAASLVERLADQKITVYLDDVLFRSFGKTLENSYIRSFEFTSEAFSSLRLVVGRPGIGLITDCVQFGIPIVTIESNGNSEIEHNAETVSKLGIGYSSKSLDDALEFGSKMYFEKAIWDRFQESILSIEMNGHLRAAEYLLEN